MTIEYPSVDSFALWCAPLLPVRWRPSGRWNFAVDSPLSGLISSTPPVVRWPCPTPKKPIEALTERHQVTRRKISIPVRLY